MKFMAFFTALIEPKEVKNFLTKRVHFCTTYWFEALNKLCTTLL
jgi:hypothetical protein